VTCSSGEQQQQRRDDRAAPAVERHRIEAERRGKGQSDTQSWAGIYLASLSARGS